MVVRFRTSRACVAAALLAGAAAWSGSAAAESSEEPPPCREAIEAGGGDPLEALADAEKAQWREAKHCEREIRKLARSSIGLGISDHALKATKRIDGLKQRIDRAVRTARALCGCREGRGDPHRTDCDFLYRRWLPPQRTVDPPRREESSY